MTAGDVATLSSEQEKSSEEDALHERDYHEHLVKLLSTVKQSVKSEMNQRQLKAEIAAKLNKRLPVSVHECKLAALDVELHQQ